jgi:hypothetical protein
MHITIEDNKVVVNLDETEFPKFQAMFQNLDRRVQCTCEFRDFGGNDITAGISLLPMHLCRTIGEANLGDDPFATMTLYPFWKYGFAFGTAGQLSLELGIDDPHKKAVAADEFGMGFCCWAMEEIFQCEFWADCSALIKAGAVFPIGSRRPDFVCGFADGSLGIFEAKGTTGTAGNLALTEGKLQAQAITAPDPISQRVVVGCALGGDTTKIVLLDPPPPDDSVGAGSPGSPVETNLTADLVRKAAMKMRKRTVGEGLRPSPTEPAKAVTIFRGPDSANRRVEIALTHDDYKEDKRHGWLEID